MRFFALAALLPVLTVVAGCNQDDEEQVTNPVPSPPASPSPKPKPDVFDGIRANINTRRSNDVHNADQRVVNLASYRRVLTAKSGDNSQQQYLIAWQNEIAQAASFVSDTEIALRYNLLMLALDSKNERELAFILYRMTATPLDLEVTLYRISPAQRAVVWNRLSLTRVNAVLDYLQPADQETLASYFGELSTIGLAPTTSVPWNRIL